MSEYFILNGKEVVPVEMMEWAKWFERERKGRIVKQENVGTARISTVFLGMDHSFGSGPPLVFETMVFGGDLDQEQERYSTYEEAEAGHAAMVQKVAALSGETS